SGLTLTQNLGSFTGWHKVQINTAADTVNFKSGCNYFVVLSCGITANQFVFGTLLGSFSLDKASLGGMARGVYGTIGNDAWNRATRSLTAAVDLTCGSFDVVREEVWGRATRTVTGFTCDVY